MNRYRLVPPLLLLLIGGSASAQPFELPLDILSLDPEAFASEPGVRIQDGRMAVERSLRYFNVTIRYVVSVNRDNPGDRYVFFIRPSGETETFTEFYRDFLDHYIERAASVSAGTYHTYEEIQLSWWIEIPREYSGTIYAFFNAERGLRGFGMNRGGTLFNFRNPGDTRMGTWLDPLQLTEVLDIAELEADGTSLQQRVWLDSSGLSTIAEFPVADFDPASGYEEYTWIVRSTDNYMTEVDAPQDFGFEGWVVQISGYGIPLRAIVDGTIENRFGAYGDATPILVTSFPVLDLPEDYEFPEFTIRVVPIPEEE